MGALSWSFTSATFVRGCLRPDAQPHALHNGTAEQVEALKSKAK
jgi:hypothetical protein